MVRETVEPPLRYVPMSWEEWLALPESARIEWVDGVAVMAPQPVRGHQDVVDRLKATLAAALPTLVVVREIGVGEMRRRVRIPDVSVVERMSDEEWLAPVTPILVVEVLSPSTRREDLLRKAPEYLEAGISQFWVVDRQARTIEVLGHGGDRWETVAVVDDAHPSAEVALGEWGGVPLDVRLVLGDAEHTGAPS